MPARGFQLAAARLRALQPDPWPRGEKTRHLRGRIQKNSQPSPMARVEVTGPGSYALLTSVALMGAATRSIQVGGRCRGQRVDCLGGAASDQHAPPSRQLLGSERGSHLYLDAFDREQFGHAGGIDQHVVVGLVVAAPGSIGAGHKGGDPAYKPGGFGQELAFRHRNSCLNAEAYSLATDRARWNHGFRGNVR